MTSASELVPRVFKALSCLYFAAALLAVLRLTVAETLFHQDTLQTVASAIHLMGNSSSAEFEQRLAEIEPARGRENLEEAVKLNPRAASAWISLGLWEDAAGIREAEGSLLKAAEVDHQYLPAWTLTNYYFRHGNSEKFWVWAPIAAALTYDDFRPLLRLCDELDSEPNRMLAHFPPNERLKVAYLNFLIGQNRLDAAQIVAKTLISDRANDPHLIDLADRLLHAGKAKAALELWNVASGFPPIEPDQGKVLTNGDLSRYPLNLGFDWRLGQNSGIFENWRASELIFDLSGEQPEECALMDQTIYLPPRAFKLQFDYSTGPDSPIGLRWALNDTEGPEIEPSQEWRKGTFALPPKRGLANLRLFYKRDPGTTRTEGRIEVRNLRLEFSS